MPHLIHLLQSQPTTLLAIGALWLCGIPFFVSLLIARSRRQMDDAKGGSLSRASWIGIIVQGFGFFPVAFGPVRVVPAPWPPVLLGEAVAVLALAGLALGLFVGSTRAMGRNWSLVARTREDHQLVTSGPFAAIRHPIYTGMFAFLLALALSLGHWRGLIVGVPLFWIGTLIRTTQEEALLRTQFGAAYDAYAARVKRFIPGVI